jgi:cytochrome c-type biogenesis protein CcmH/NrfG
MRRDTIVFTLAGVVFGFILGYMSAGWGDGPAVVSTAPAEAPGPGSAPSLDPNEVRALETLADRSPGDVVARVELGNLHMDHERWDEAIRWYREALSLSPDLVDVRTDLGACLVHSGRPAEGLAEFEAVLRQDENHRNALYNRGIALVQMGRPAEAAAAWEEVLRRHPGDPQLGGLPAQIENLRATSGGSSS